MTLRLHVFENQHKVQKTKQGPYLIEAIDLYMHCQLQMHVAERQSIPNLHAASSGAAGLPHTIGFDSLKSLPQRDYLQPHYQSQQQPPGEIVFVMSEHVLVNMYNMFAMSCTWACRLKCFGPVL